MDASESPVLRGNVSANQTCEEIQSQHAFDHGEGGIIHEYSLWFVVPMAVIITFASLAAVVGNGLVVATIARHRGMRTRTNLLLANLAVADILVGAVDMPFSLLALIKGQWVFGLKLCQFNAFTTGLALMASIHTLMFISIHKYISMTRPFSRAMTPLRIGLMAASTWVWGIFYNSLPFFGVTENVYKEGATQCGPIIPCTSPQKIHSLINTVMNFLVPLFVMCYCNYKIASVVRDHMGRMRQTSNVNYKNSVLQQKHITMTLKIVMLCFVFCWVPYITYSCSLVLLTNKTMVPLYLNPIVYWCGYINSACNPIIYAFRSPSFRQGYLEILCRAKADPRLGSFYSGSGSSRMKHASQRTYLSQLSRKNLKQDDKKGLSRFNMGLDKINEVTVRQSLLPNSGIVSKAVMNHLRFRSQRMGNLKRWPSTPLMTPQTPNESNPLSRRLRRYDTDTCLLPTVTSGLDLMGYAPEGQDDPSSSFHTLPPEDPTKRAGEEVGIILINEFGSERRLRTESGAFVVCVQDGAPIVDIRVVITDVDAISNASLQTLTRSWAEELSAAVLKERHKNSVQSLVDWGEGLDVSRVRSNVATPDTKRITHHMVNPRSMEEAEALVKRCRSDPGGLALKRLGSIERLGQRPLRFMPPEVEQPNLRDVETRRPGRGLLAATKAGGLRNSIMALFGKASSTYNVGTNK